MSARHDDVGTHGWSLFLNVLSRAGHGWTLTLNGLDHGDDAELLRRVVAAARHRGVSVVPRPPQSCPGGTGRNPPFVTLTNGLFWATLITSHDPARAPAKAKRGGRERVDDEEQVREHPQHPDTRPVTAQHARTIGDDFSEIECAIASLVSQGLTNHQIANRVSLSAHTVNYYLRKIFRKLGVKSRVELARVINDRVVDETHR